jgi:hypothetical protein
MNEDSLLTSPIPGPPNTRMSSDEDPPLSDIGMMLQHISLSLPLKLPSRRTLIIDLLAQRTSLILRYLPKYINQVVRRATTRKDNDMTFVHVVSLRSAKRFRLRACRIISSRETKAS